MDIYLIAAAAVVVVGFIEIFSGFRTVRFLGALFTVSLIHAELAAVALVRRIHPPKHVVLGDCVQCGDCCKSILSNPPKFLKSGRGLRVFIAFHRVLHNFSAVARGPNGEIFFSCGHLRADNRCGIYWRRPLFCRTYPVLPYYDAPKLLPQCSYRVASRVVSEMKPRSSLPILNPTVAVYHPTPDGELVTEDDFELVEMVPGEAPFPAKPKTG